MTEPDHLDRLIEPDRCREENCCRARRYPDPVCCGIKRDRDVEPPSNKVQFVAGPCQANVSAGLRLISGVLLAVESKLAALSPDARLRASSRASIGTQLAVCALAAAHAHQPLCPEERHEVLAGDSMTSSARPSRRKWNVMPSALGGRERRPDLWRWWQ